jgi:hypothetical protein
MLPGFRFLFAAIMLSMSILVFGFGAAALLRTAHEEFASTPSWQPAPETRFAQSREATPPLAQPSSQPVLALLRVDDAPQAAAKETPGETPDTLKAGLPASNAAPADQAATVATAPQSEPEKIAAVQPADSSPPEVTKETANPQAAMPEAAATETPATEAPPRGDAAADATAAADPSRIAATEQTSEKNSEPALPPADQAAPTPAVETTDATPEQAAAEPANAADVNGISSRIATLGGPPVTIEQPKAKPDTAKSGTARSDSAKSDSSAVKKRQHARQELRRRRILLRARLARQTQQLDAFGQPTTR